MKKVCTALFTCLLFLSTFSQTPKVDSGFGKNGFFQEAYGEGAATIFSSARQSDGKVILAGNIEKQVHSLQTKSYSTGNLVAFLGRILPTGILDSTFGENGFVTLSGGHSNDRFSFVHTDSTDRIYVMGHHQSDRIIGRYLPDGQPDSSYGIHGFYHPTHLLNGRNHVVNAVTLMPDGSTVLAGASINELSLTKFKANGFPDSTFHWDGQVTSQFLPSEPTETAVDVAVQNDSLILALGNSLGDGYLARYLPDGRVDQTFGNNGHRLIPMQRSLQNLAKIYVYPDQRFIVAAKSLGKFHLLAFTADGRPDSSRFVNGESIQPVAITTSLAKFYVRQNGDIFIMDGSGNPYLILTKFSPSGILDSTFGYAAQVRLQIENRNTFPHSLVFLPGDSLLVLATHDQRVSTIKLDPTGNLAYSFHGTGHINQRILEGGSVCMKLRQDNRGNIWTAGASFWAAGLNPFGINSWPHNLITQISADGKTSGTTYPSAFPGLNTGISMDVVPMPDGSAYFTGTETVVDSVNSELFVSKILPGGEIDTSFGKGGFFHFRPAIQANRGKIGQAIGLQPDGKIIIAATLATDLFFDPKMCLIRLNTQGRLDTSFNTFGYRIMGNPAAFQRARDMEILSDGSILIGGQLAAADALSLAKALPNGERDLQFGTNGFAQSNINGSGELNGGYFAIKNNGKIIQAGSKNGKIYLFQYNPDGGLDGSFGNSGKRNITARPYCTLRDVVMAPNGDILLVGDFPIGSISEVFIICLDENGILKNSFGNNGFFLLEMPGNSDYGFSLLPLPNGDLLLGGAAGNQSTVVRLLRGLALNSTHDWGESNSISPFVYPNPIAKRATLQLELTQREQLTVSLLNMQGQTIDLLYSGEQFAGKQELELSFQPSLSTGYYLLKIQSEREVAFIKVLMK